MATTRAVLEKEIRDTYSALLVKALQDAGEEVLMVGAGKYAVPCVDADGNESCAVISVTIPRGTRNAEHTYDPFDCYAAAEAYKTETAEKAEKKKAADEKKAAKIAADKARREAKKEKEAGE